VFTRLSSTKDQSESPCRNSARYVGSDYDTTSQKLGFQSSIEVYDDIDELRAGYAEMQSVKPEEQATSSDAPISNDDPIFSDAPEPPPPRPPHEYLALIDV